MQALAQLENTATHSGAGTILSKTPMLKKNKRFSRMKIAPDDIQESTDSIKPAQKFMNSGATLMDSHQEHAKEPHFALIGTQQPQLRLQNAKEYMQVR